MDVLSRVFSFFPLSNNPGESDSNPLTIYAVPGLMTLLDCALFRAVEGECTATITTGHQLLGKGQKRNEEIWVIS
jgi:hypothetical protein